MVSPGEGRSENGFMESADPKLWVVDKVTLICISNRLAVLTKWADPYPLPLPVPAYAF